ncbi:Uncharacterised protein [Mycobacteroides abscessus subsp. abscessus]|nr:Uncharacterised protein [Mycobacteroides abscessus subsp. abscessus]
MRLAAVTGNLPLPVILPNPVTCTKASRVNGVAAKFGTELTSSSSVPTWIPQPSSVISDSVLSGNPSACAMKFTAKIRASVIDTSVTSRPATRPAASNIPSLTSDSHVQDWHTHMPRTGNGRSRPSP